MNESKNIIIAEKEASLDYNSNCSKSSSMAVAEDNKVLVESNMAADTVVAAAAVVEESILESKFTDEEE